MRKQIFQDLLTGDSRLPSSLWKFYILSFGFHVLMLFLFVSIDLKPPEVEPNKTGNRYGEDAPRDVIRAGSAMKNEGYKVSFGSRRPGNRNGNEGENRGRGEQDYGSVSNRGEPVIIDQYPPEYSYTPEPAPAVAYRHQDRQGNAPISGDQQVQFYNKPFLDAQKMPQSNFPVQRNAPVAYNPFNGIKKYIDKEEMPPLELIKIEEMINYFDYDYALPEEGQPFAVTLEVDVCPWYESHLLLLIGLQGKIEEPDDQLRQRDFVIARKLRTNVSFDDRYVKAYRLIGYVHHKPVPGESGDNAEGGGYSRGELRLGQRMTTLYEIIPQEFQRDGEEIPASLKIADVTFDYIDPEKPGKGKQHLSLPANWEEENQVEASEDFLMAAAAAQFGMILGNPVIRRFVSVDDLIRSVKDSLGDDPDDRRVEFLQVLEAFKKIQQKDLL